MTHIQHLSQGALQCIGKTPKEIPKIGNKWNNPLGPFCCLTESLSLVLFGSSRLNYKSYLSNLVMETGAYYTYT